MRYLILPAFALVLTLAACGPAEDRAIIKEYNELRERHQKSYHDHDKVDKRQEDLVGYHDQLEAFIAEEENPDTALVNALEHHETFFRKHDSIMKAHADMMKTHEAFEARFEAGEVDDEELRDMIDKMRAEHDQMELDHEYVNTETRKLRSEHNDLRRKYNELKTKK